MIKKVELDIGDGRILSLETGRVAREAGGAVIVRLGDTMILAAATASNKPREGVDFMPLLVDFEEKLYAVGKIPGGFFKREGRPTERAVLTARLIDRPIRPLFNAGYRNDVQIVITPLSVDQENPPDILAMIGASAALSISEIPFEGPAGAVRVGFVDGKYILNPTVTQMKESSLDLVIAGTKDLVLMIEAGAEEVSEELMLEGIKAGHDKIREFIKLQEELVALAGKPKQKPELYKPNAEIEKLVSDLSTKKVEEALHIIDKDKQGEALDAIEKEMTEKVGENEKLKTILEKSRGDVKQVLYNIQKKVVRKNIIDKGKRPDGRGIKEIRPISCEIGLLPRAHGSGLFTRGGTQVLTAATLGSMGEMQRIEGL
ncbi:MAG: polyribonucleotide nucleotidyltransferase, partial [Candidatus Saganbacteria bacterium]|nr:polyribonucleotide nucleotidyltransferase [Candidatus Saganbacteria bacterium]